MLERVQASGKGCSSNEWNLAWVTEHWQWRTRHADGVLGVQHLSEAAVARTGLKSGYPCRLLLASWCLPPSPSAEPCRVPIPPRSSPTATQAPVCPCLASPTRSTAPSRWPRSRRSLADKPRESKGAEDAHEERSGAERSHPGRKHVSVLRLSLNWPVSARLPPTGSPVLRDRGSAACGRTRAAAASWARVRGRTRPPAGAVCPRPHRPSRAAHLMPCPQPPKLLVLQRQLANQRGELHIVGALADIHPQNADDCRSHAGRFGEPIARFRREEDLPGHVPLPGR